MVSVHMDEAPGVSAGYRRVSVWPVFVAVSIPLAEVGILFGLLPVTVGALMLFGLSVAGLATETGFARSLWRGLAGVSVPLGALGWLFTSGIIGLPIRGVAIAAAAGLLLLGAVLGEYVIPPPARV